MSNPSIGKAAGVLIAAGLGIVAFAVAVLCVRSARTWNTDDRRVHSSQSRLSTMAAWAGLTMVMVGILLLFVSMFFG